MTVANYKNKARENAYIFFGICKHNKKYVLHHKDIYLKEKDIKRYNEWRPEDLVVLTRAEHARLHHTGAKRSKEGCEKISKANKGRKNNFTFYKNIETGKTISVKNGEEVPFGFIKGRIVSNETIKKISNSKKGSTPWNKGIKLSEEEKNKQRGKNIGRFIGCKSVCSKKVNQYDLCGNFIRCFGSMNEAERELKGLSRKHIGACCSGKRKTHGGFIWKYA